LYSQVLVRIWDGSLLSKLCTLRTGKKIGKFWEKNYVVFSNWDLFYSQNWKTNLFFSKCSHYIFSVWKCFIEDCDNCIIFYINIMCDPIYTFLQNWHLGVNWWSIIIFKNTVFWQGSEKVYDFDFSLNLLLCWTLPESFFF